MFNTFKLLKLYYSYLVLIQDCRHMLKSLLAYKNLIPYCFLLASYP